MDDNLRRKANEVFQRELGKGQSSDAPKSELVAMRAQSLAGLDLSAGNICGQAPKIIDMIQGEMKLLSWFIPDKIETPAKAFLRALEEVILPAFCGAVEGAAAKSEPVVKKNFAG